MNENRLRSALTLSVLAALVMVVAIPFSGWYWYAWIPPIIAAAGCAFACAMRLDQLERSQQTYSTGGKP